MPATCVAPVEPEAVATVESLPGAAQVQLPQLDRPIRRGLAMRLSRFASPVTRQLQNCRGERCDPEVGLFEPTGDTSTGEAEPASVRVSLVENVLLEQVLEKALNQILRILHGIRLPWRKT